MYDYPNFDGTQACTNAPPAAARAYAGAAGADPRPAQQLCASCRFRTECLSFALHTDTYGVWGGLTEDQREQLRTQNASPAPTSVSGELDALVLALRAHHVPTPNTDDPTVGAAAS
ncbi:MAG: WhiB family transcriptional regulator [Humibacillus sp.]|nr:WhiB family transcriptional regulator [Humibacillus sp.]